MSNEIIFGQGAVLSFPHLVEAHKAPTAAPTVQPKFSADFIFAPDHPVLAAFMKRYAEMAQAKWGENANAVMSMIQSDRKNRCFGMGAEKVDKKTFKPYSGYEGNAYITASRADRPQMIRPDGSAVDPANTMEYQALARKLYGGCYVNVALKPWIQENSFGRGIRCDLVAVQFFKDGTPFGESEPDVSNMFGAVAAPAQAPAAAPAAFGMPGLPSFM
jgi:hypothetical protein